MPTTNNPTLSQASRPFSNSDPEHNRQALAGALAVLSTLATTWLRRAGASPSQIHWEDCERVQFDDGEVSRG